MKIFIFLQERRHSYEFLKSYWQNIFKRRPRRKIKEFALSSLDVDNNQKYQNVYYN